VKRVPSTLREVRQDIEEYLERVDFEEEMLDPVWTEPFGIDPLALVALAKLNMEEVEGLLAHLDVPSKTGGRYGPLSR
jgi:hypothetical protein